MREQELKEKLGNLNSEIQILQKSIDDKKKAIAIKKREQEAINNLLPAIEEAEETLKLLKEEDDTLAKELEG